MDTMTVWQAIRMARNEEELTLREAEQLDMVFQRSALSCSQIAGILTRRSGVEWVLCEGSHYLWPEYQMTTLVDDDSIDYAAPYLRLHDYFVWAEHVCGEVGWARCTEVLMLPDGTYITRDLYEEEYCACYACDDIIHVGGAYFDDSDRCYCYDCYTNLDHDDEDDEEEDSQNGRYNAARRIRGEFVWSYSTNPMSVLYPYMEPGKRHFGIELECEFPHADRFDVAERVMRESPRLTGLAIWKEDGSLNDGLELVTAPKMLAYWQEPNPVKSLCEYGYFRNKARSHDTTTCGLHVHVSRDTIPEPVIAKLVVLMNEPAMRETTSLIARRAPTVSYCMAKKKRWHSDRNRLQHNGYTPAWQARRDVRFIDCRQKPQDGRYTPVNLTPHTVEFRIFRGTLKWETILASIEFCDAAISFCTQMGASAMNPEAFVAWMKDNVTRKTYPALRDYLEQRTVLPQRKAKPKDVVTESHVDPEEPSAVDPYEGRREHLTNSTFCEVDGDHYFVVAAGYMVNSREHGLIRVNAGETWWNPTRTCSLQVVASYPVNSDLFA